MPAVVCPRLRVALIAGLKHPIAQPFPGGMEAHTWLLARELERLGHQVTLFAGPGSDPSAATRLHTVDLAGFRPTAAAERDVSMTSLQVVAEHHAYLSVMMEVLRRNTFDVVHINAYHYLPVSLADLLPRPPVLTLHTPPTPWLESAMLLAGRVHAVAVSQVTRAAWAHAPWPVRLIRNGIDLQRFRPGPGGRHAVWTGRLVPEKGAHLAIDAARLAGVPIVLAGPAADPRYVAEQITPRLGPGVTWAGHLPHDELAELVGSAAACLVTPRWDEPFGLVVAEALACGTPVAAFARGALPEVTDPGCAALAAPDDVPALADALVQAIGLDRRLARRHAEATFDGTEMARRYVQTYRRSLVAEQDVLAPVPELAS